MKTPQIPYAKLASAIGVPEVYLKREDLDHYGSHKGRSIPAMIETYQKKHKIKNFVISSSGNAGLAAIIAVQNHNANNQGNQLKLTALVGNKIPEQKLDQLQSLAKNDQNISVIQTDNPKQQAFQMDKDGIAKFLRQSTDDLALIGYFELAKELSHIPNLQAVFIPTSSGTTAQALGDEFQKLKLPIQIHIVQTTDCHPIADAFSSDKIETTETSIAGAIVDNIAHRKDKVVEEVNNTHGFGWIVNNDEIRAAMELIYETTEVKISANSALSAAGLKKAVQNGWKWEGPIVCLITGK